MEITPLAIFYGSLLGIILAALFVIMYRQGRSPTHSDMQSMERHLNETIRQTRDDLKREITEANNAAINAAVAEITANTDRQINELRQDLNGRMQRVEHQIDALRQDFNRMMNALANHEHVNGRVVVAVLPDAEPVPTAADD